MRHPLLIAVAAPLVLYLAGCAGGPLAAGGAERDVDWATAPLGASGYGLFLAGQAALNDGRSDEAAAYFEQAAATGDLDAGVVSERAFIAAVLAGDISKAAALAPEGEEASEGGRRLGQLAVAVEDMAHGRGKEASQILAGDAIGFPHRSAAALLQPWASAMAGDVEGSLVRPEVRGDRLVEYIGQLGQAHLFERARRYDEAETDFKALAQTDRPSEMAVLAYGGFLERRGRRADAIALYDAALAREPHRASYTAARARAAAGRSAPQAPSLKEGAAQAMLAPAAAMLSAKQNQLGLAYLRLALHLDPRRAEAWVMVGDVMAAAGEFEQARAAYEKVKPGAAEYATARAKLAWAYQAADDPETAIRIAREAAASGDTDARLNLADLLRANERFAESAEILTDLIAQQSEPDWRLLYARGVAFERTGRWAEAEKDLQAALDLRPDEPELLNYLGYSWIDRGERLKEALGMVEKAVASNPRNGAMIDSLGWAHYRLGDYAKAVELLEEAVELEAGDPEINNHLGDAYWRVGRRDEAEFQWRRVLTLDPDARIKADAEAKLASGLGLKGPAEAPRVAGP
ncbi:MAG: tetratricopeptide repeat protein [Phenylobacterium sp.]|uniref:tetratricopeptide repeat protein n=1 Tax=Phenylobacterium sp. TaxID=1871053 RepID=UPI003919E353